MTSQLTLRPKFEQIISFKTNNEHSWHLLISSIKWPNTKRQGAICDTEIRLNHLRKIESERPRLCVCVFNQSCCLFANCSQMETYSKWPSSLFPTQFWTYFFFSSFGFPGKWGGFCQPSDVLCTSTLTPAKYLAIFRSVNDFPKIFGFTKLKHFRNTLKTTQPLIRRVGECIRCECTHSAFGEKLFA